MPRFAQKTWGPVAVALALGCHEHREVERRESAQATMTAEQMASEGTLTSATVERREPPAEAERVREEAVAAFRLEQSDYRLRLQRALDALDKDPASRRIERRADANVAELRARRPLLRADLEAVDRCTGPDWGPLRTRIDRDLAPSGP